MPFALLIVGAAFLISGVRGTDDKFLELLKGDFNGNPSFVSWMIAILLIGSLGYIEPIKPVSRAMLVLIIVVLFLKKGQGFFPQFTAQISGQQSNAPSASAN